jgi:isochorismate pyruvate lyase
MPPEMIEMVGAQWRNMIGWFVQFEEEKLRQAQDAAEKSGANGGT